MKQKKEQPWIMIRRGEVVNVFKNRRMGVKHYKKLLTQTLKDFEKQDKSDEYNYPIEVFGIEIKPVKERDPHLGL